MIPAFMLLFALLFGQATVPAPPKEEIPKTVSPVPAAPKTMLTDAEKIANTSESIKQAEVGIKKIQERLDDPDGEYPKAELEFTSLNTKLKELKAEAMKLRTDGKEAEAKAIEEMIPTVEKDWQLSKERFDIAIRQRKASQESLLNLKERLESDRELLARLEGSNLTEPIEKANGPTSPVPLKNGKPNPNSPAPKITATTTKEPAPAAKELTNTIPPIPGLPTFPSDSGTEQESEQSSETNANSTATQNSLVDENDPMVQLAREHLEINRAKARDAEERKRLAESRHRAMENSIASSNKVLELERESAAQITKTLEHISETLSTNPPADATARDELVAKQRDAEDRLRESKERQNKFVERMTTMNETLAALKTELDAATNEALAAQANVEESEKELSNLINPFAPRNLFQWFLKKAPRVLLIIAGLVILHLFVRQFSRQIVRFVTRNSVRGSEYDRENRANTLVGVFRYVAGLVIFGGGTLMLLDVVGVPVVPLMGGAAVMGLAVAFGAQNLIRDYFTGFMMLLEDQYSVNDVVRIGTISGMVEQITLRMTVLRDLEGVRHFMPHGTITSVSNLTHGWSRALMAIPVAYKENVDRCIDVLMQIGNEMRLDPELGQHIIENPEMLGVDELADSGVVIKFLLKTRPLKQWPIKRELLRRIKNRFDELGIEIPFPHRTVYHKFPEGREENFFSSNRVANGVHHN